MHQFGYFYILSNTHNTVLYCGATTDLYKRTLEHKNRLYTNSFTSRYNIDKLVYFEVFSLPGDAFAREKQIKGGSRKKKISLIESRNPEWKDLFELFQVQKGEELIRLKNFFSK
jgi:putative endonuclease